MRIVLCGLILGGAITTSCAHQQRSYSLGDELSVLAAGMEVGVRNERQSPAYGARKGPLLVMRPRADFAASHCYEGVYNPYEVSYSDTQGLQQSFALCQQANDPNAYSLDLHGNASKFETLAEQTAVKEIVFTARAAPGAAQIKVDGAQARNIPLPADAAPFTDHPEYIGAMIALGVWPASGNLTR